MDERELSEQKMNEEEKAPARKTGGAERAAGCLNEVGHVISVMSGKGGVGKSLVSALLAVSLRRAGHQVGVLDADITGPSIPKMLFPQRPRLAGSSVALVPPQSRTGIRVMSIDMLLESEEQPVIWRGPLVARAIQQFGKRCCGARSTTWWSISRSVRRTRR